MELVLANYLEREDAVMWIGLGVSFLAGAFLLTLAVVFVFRTGIVYSNRKEDGTLKTKMPLMGYVVMGLTLILILAFFVLCDYLTFRVVSAGIVRILAFNMLLITLLSLYDGCVIDLWVLGKVRPSILSLPDAVTIDSMKRHVKKQFTAAWVLKIPLALVSGLVYDVLF